MEVREFKIKTRSGETVAPTIFPNAYDAWMGLRTLLPNDNAVLFELIRLDSVLDVLPFVHNVVLKESILNHPELYEEYKLFWRPIAEGYLNSPNIKLIP